MRLRSVFYGLSDAKITEAVSDKNVSYFNVAVKYKKKLDKASEVC